MLGILLQRSQATGQHCHWTHRNRSSYGWTHHFLVPANTSWTFELWIYPQSVPSGPDSPLIARCPSQSTDRCLHLIIRNQKVYFGFYNDDVSGVQTLVPLRWYHLAFVFDCSTRNQSIYIDGFLDSNRQASGCYQGGQGNLTIGFLEYPLYVGSYYYDGFIDQLSYTSRSKTADEILRDATLTVYFSFDNGSTADGGPLDIDGSCSGSTNFSAGRVGDALQINDVSDSYFRVSGLVLLGRRNQSYSLAIWIRPSVLKNSTIIHVSAGSTGQGWCLPMLTLSSSGYLRTMSWSGVAVTIAGPIISLNQWTHAAITYSMNNGLRLYVNGTLRNSSLPFSFVASGSANYVFVGSSLTGIFSCGPAPYYTGQYAGLVDELPGLFKRTFFYRRIRSREPLISTYHRTLHLRGFRGSPPHIASSEVLFNKLGVWDEGDTFTIIRKFHQVISQASCHSIISRSEGPDVREIDDWQSSAIEDMHQFLSDEWFQIITGVHLFSSINVAWVLNAS